MSSITEVQRTLDDATRIKMLNVGSKYGQLLPAKVVGSIVQNSVDSDEGIEYIEREILTLEDGLYAFIDYPSLAVITAFSPITLLAELHGSVDELGIEVDSHIVMAMFVDLFNYEILSELRNQDKYSLAAGGTPPL